MTSTSVLTKHTFFDLSSWILFLFVFTSPFFIMWLKIRRRLQSLCAKAWGVVHKTKQQQRKTVKPKPNQKFQNDWAWRRVKYKGTQRMMSNIACNSFTFFFKTVECLCDCVPYRCCLSPCRRWSSSKSLCPGWPTGSWWCTIKVRSIQLKPRLRRTERQTNSHPLYELLLIQSSW